MKKVLVCCLAGLFAIALSAQDAPKPPVIPQTNRTAITRLTNQMKSFPEEKVYLQLDRPYYSAGDRLWFRAYMVHSAIHSTINLSRYIYVELLNAHNDVIVRKKIRPTDEGIFFGQLDLTPELADGWYSIRAYTNFMRNIGEDFFYRRKIYIGNGLKGLSGVTVNERTTSNMGKSALSSAQKTEAFDVQFFPEGGHLVAGNMQIIGFKAIGANGLGTDVNGRIVDNMNNEVTAFKSTYLGMGKIMLMPEAGKTYSAICEDNMGQKRTIRLPEVSSTNYSLCVQQTNTIMSITVMTPEQAQRTDTLYLIGCLRGLPIFQTTILPEDPGYTFSKNGMNTGVTQMILMNNKCEVLSERLVFVNGNDDAKLSVAMDKTNYQRRDAVHAALILKDSKGNPLEGNFSVSVTDDNDAKIDSSELTIKSYMLLQSDLKGFIENPNGYFRPENRNAPTELDILMLTQGWKRYDTKAAIAGNYAKCDTYEVERGPIISGRVQNFPVRRGISGNNVSMYFLNKKNHFDGATTDNTGRFEFICPEFPDSTSIRIDAAKKPGQFVELVINPDTFPACGVSCVFPDNLKQNVLMKTFLKKSRDRYYLVNGMMSYNLEKVEVYAKRTDKNKKIREERGSYYSDPSYTISEDALETATSIMDVLSMSPGVTLNATADGVLIRNAVPLVMVDNMEWTMEDLRNLNVSEVKMIDILKDPGQLAIFGSKGANGAICIYLKRGEERNNEPVVLGRNQTEIMPLGYSLPAEFYVPKYQVESNKQNPLPDLRSTIYWKPNVKTSPTGEADLFFFTADGTGTYTITAEGMTPTGEVIRYQGKMNRK